MGRTLRMQVALYLDDEKVAMLAELAKKTGMTKQDLLRQALDALFAEHKLLKASKCKP